MSEIFEPGTVKPEADYIELERLSRKLGIPVPMTYIEVKATGPDGETTGLYKDRSRTVNRNYWNWLFTSLGGCAISSGTFGAGVLSVKDTGGTTRTIKGQDVNTNAANVDTGAAIPSSFQFSSIISVATSGIVVGTGVTAESFEHNALVTPVAQGTGSGQMSYQAQTAPAPSYSAGPPRVWTAAHSRILNNNSGGTIVVAETGIYASIVYAANTQGKFMVCRDLLGSPVSVLNGGQLTVTYTFTLTFPA